jgi:guanylate kinase
MSTNARLMIKGGAGLLTLGGFGAYTYKKYQKNMASATPVSTKTTETKKDQKPMQEGRLIPSRLLRRKTNNPHLESFSACRPLVICGPSGVGKSSLIKKLVADYPEDFGFSVSHTTRGPRKGEEDGVDYHFTTTEDMLNMIKNGEFIEHAHVHNRIYGTSIKAVTDVTNRRQICILDIDVQGVQSVMESTAHEELNPKYLFIRPVSIDILEKRLISRATDSLQAINQRVQTASFELEVAAKLPFDEVIVNDKLDQAYMDLKNFIDEQRKTCKVCRDEQKMKQQMKQMKHRTSNKA